MLRRSFLGLLPAIPFFGLKPKETEPRFVMFGIAKHYIDENNQVYLHEYPNGSKHWFKNGIPHRDNGPAIEHDNGDKSWYQNGMRHRDNGPAIEYANGTKSWYQCGKLHRDDGPAIEYANGSKLWYKNGYPHRDDLLWFGPAMERAETLKLRETLKADAMSFTANITLH